MRYRFMDWYTSTAALMMMLMLLCAALSLFWYWAGAVAIGLFLINLIESRLSYNSRKRKVEQHPEWFFGKWE